tara:strand:- start:36 stop:299 length:264 start_codon:yes stop_codon:yes gene_type:complete
MMSTRSKEIIHHFTCSDCKGWWSVATMEEWEPKKVYCTHCGKVSKEEVNRFEVIDATGRLIVKYGVDVQLSYQDDGKTLKVFLKEKE